MDDIFEEPDDATPLSEEEKQGLIPSYISTRAELNQAEQRNITQAEIWAFNTRRNPLDVRFLKNLHKRMFLDVWTWAGEFRKTERNIGVEAYLIPTQLKQLVEDIQYQIDNKSYSLDEIATRFHHRLVFIHPFPNGNGRHSRMATDLLLKYLSMDRFSWGAGDLAPKGEIRSKYIAALREADKQNYEPLLVFVRSGKRT
ncbi:MAG: Fic-DOC domain mobile mystery protein B [Saprospiraceae bacterium]|jgi:Fic-DOC domain mobile mystery protein B